MLQRETISGGVWWNSGGAAVLSCTRSRSHLPWRESKSRSHGIGNLGGEGWCQLKMAPGSMNQEMNVRLEGEEEKSYRRTGGEICANCFFRTARLEI